MAVITNHPRFPAPEPATVLWRYSSLTKFLPLLTSEKLFFPSLLSLRADDPFEGLTSSGDRVIAKMLEENAISADSFFADHHPDLRKTSAYREGVIRQLKGAYHIAQNCFVNCWHARPRESAALWKLYSGTPAGLAIKTSVERVTDALSAEKDLIVGKVEYCDYDTTHLDPTNMLTAAFTKRDSFEFEHEVRVLYWTGDIRAPEAELPGISVDCNPRKLIDEVVVNPYAPPWIVHTIEEVINRLGFQFTVRQSRFLNPDL